MRVCSPGSPSLQRVHRRGNQRIQNENGSRCRSIRVADYRYADQSHCRKSGISARKHFYETLSDAISLAPDLFQKAVEWEGHCSITTTLLPPQCSSRNLIAG